MKKILFVCWGNICRSPSAEFIMKSLVHARDADAEYVIRSAAVSTEELGSPIYPPAAACLRAHGVPYDKRAAVQVTKRDYDAYDLIVGMDLLNRERLLRIFGGDPQGKVRLLHEFSGLDHPVADPWYTRDFECAYREIKAGCEGIVRYFSEE